MKTKSFFSSHLFVFLNKRLNQSGFSLIGAVIMLALLTAITIPLLQITNNDNMDTFNELNKGKAFFNAAAGLEWAKQKLSIGDNPNTNYMAFNESGGVNDGFGVLADPGTGWITSTGKVNGALSVQKIQAEFAKDCVSIDSTSSDDIDFLSAEGNIRNIEIKKICNGISNVIIDKMSISWSSKNALQLLDNIFLNDTNVFDNRASMPPYGSVIDDTSVDIEDFTLVGLGVLLDLEAPTIPGSPNYSNLMSDSVTITWVTSTDNVSVSNYLIYRDGIEVGSSAGLFFDDTGRTPGSTHLYTVKAADLAGNLSGESDVVTVNFPMGAGDIDPPTIPGNLLDSNLVSNQVTLSWDASTDNVAINDYILYRDGAEVGHTSSLNMTDINQTPGSTHIYTVKATDTSGNISGASNQVTVIFPSGGGGGTPPLGGGTPPLGGGTPPLGGGTPPLGGGTPPLGGGTPPLGGGTPPPPPPVEPEAHVDYMHFHYAYPAGMNPTQPTTFILTLTFTDGSTYTHNIVWE